MGKDVIIACDFDSKEKHNVTLITKISGEKFKEYLLNTAAQQ